ncbi:bestrophin-1-like [Daphnia pulex]|uniref:bestrophin-1-like n=1 Tax=Daphnia pulex TaxID=6669 RepID=UPI001EE02CFB|nr:bestrophin-1-like [Daphnia pulex]
MSSNISAMQYSTRNERVNAITEIPLNNLNASQQQTSTTAVPIWHNNTTKHPAISSILSTPAQQSRSPMFGESFLTLFQWKGSIYKTLWKHFLIYCALYYLLTVVHKFALNGEQKKTFEALAKYCMTNPPSPTNLIIMLSFFTTTAMQRRFSVQINMAGTSRLISVFVMGLKPNLREGPVIVEHYARWVVLSWVLTYRIVCKPLRDLFPDMTSLQRAGIIQNSAERMILEKMEIEGDPTPRPLVVIDWLILLIKKTHKKGRFAEYKYYLQSVENVLAYKKNCGNTIKFATKNIPYALIQVAVIVVYLYGIFTLMARNFDGVEKSVLLGGIVNYFPAFSSIQFFIFLVWLNFGRTAVNPFGSDDDDIDVKQLLATHIQDSLRLAKLYNQDLLDLLGEMPPKPNTEGSTNQNAASAAK